MSGQVVGIGVGPGDPELITLKAARLLQAADLLVYPAPETGESLARAIAAPHLANSRAAEYAMRMPMVADRFPAQDVYQAAVAVIKEAVAQGQLVIVLCEGDPLFFGSFMYLYERLVDQVPVSIVPGVSSLTAAAAMAGLPLAARNDVVSVLPAPLSDERLSQGLATAETLVLLKLGRHLPRVRALLAHHSLLGQTIYIERATMPDQKVVPLTDLALDHEAPYFSLLIVRRAARVVP